MRPPRSHLGAPRAGKRYGLCIRLLPVLGAGVGVLAAETELPLCRVAFAQPVTPSENPPPIPPTDDDKDGPSRFSTYVRAPRSVPGRAVSTVGRTELEERLPRSTPDALRYEPGVYVQQTAHGQGSAFVRGVTGQMTVLLYDGVRLNNSLYRQGPNQYFFTIDSQTIDEIVVQRGSASVRHGSDALGGSVEALPIGPSWAERPSKAQPAKVLHPQLLTRFATADSEAGGRLRLSGWLSPRLGFVVGGGYRNVGPLQGRAVQNVDSSLQRYPEVPRYQEDGLSQLGTGFREGTADFRLVIPIGPADSNNHVVLAAYQYLQFDSPRTDQCPPALAPLTECLLYEQQFRTLAYGSLRTTTKKAALRRVEATLSYQLQHEKRRRDRPLDRVVEHGIDDVHTLGATLRAESAQLRNASGWFGMRFRYGLDLYHDQVKSEASLEVQDLGFTRNWSRGQYIGGSRYTTLGVFLEGEAVLKNRLYLRPGARLGMNYAYVPEDKESATRPVDRPFVPYAFDIGIEVRALPALRFFVNLNQGFRTPNLDDLSSRQATGPGYQFESASLTPEKAVTLEAGARLSTPFVTASAFVFNMGLYDAIVRSPRSIADCPTGERGTNLAAPGCATAWSRFQLVNLDGRAQIWGTEAAVLLHLPLRIDLSASFTYTYGEGPNPTPMVEGQVGYQAVVPLSRIPPVNGTAEVRFRPLRGILVGAGLRWAGRQDRLAPSDYNDPRIPRGGTPGFAVVDLRAGLRLHELLPARVLRRATAMMVVENAGNVAYRYHGSSVNGPSSGVVFSLDVER